MAIAGTLTGTSRHTGLLRFFLRNTGRFPQSGGHRIVPGLYEVRVQGRTRNGTALPDVVWGPANVGDRAIVDLNFGSDIHAKSRGNAHAIVASASAAP